MTGEEVLVIEIDDALLGGQQQKHSNKKPSKAPGQRLVRPQPPSKRRKWPWHSVALQGRRPHHG